MAKKKGRRDNIIPTFSAIDPDYLAKVESLRKRITDYYEKIKGGPEKYEVPELVKLLKEVISVQDMEELRGFEYRQSQVRISTINGHPMSYQSGSHVQRRNLTDTLENVLFTEFAQYLPYVERGIQDFLCIEPCQVNWKYTHVASSVSIDGIRQLVGKNETVRAGRISSQFHEYPTNMGVVGPSQDVVKRLLEIVIRDREIMRNKRMYTERTEEQSCHVVLDSTRHCWTATNLWEIYQQMEPELKTRGLVQRTIKFDTHLEVHSRLKTAGELLIRGKPIRPEQAQPLSHSYARKYAAYLAGGRDDVYDLLAGRTIGDFRLFEPVMGRYMYAVNSNPDTWRGRINGHDFKDAKHESSVRDLIIGESKPREPYGRFLRRIADDVVFEKTKSVRAQKEYIPPHIEVLVPVNGMTEDGTAFEMVVARQWWSPEGFTVSQKRDGISHNFYKAQQMRELLNKETNATMAIYAFVCGLVFGYPGLLEADQMPLVEQLSRLR